MADNMLQIHELVSLGRDLTDTDVLAVDTGALTAKVDYGSLKQEITDGDVKFSAAQSLTDAQKAQARGNIGAASAADVGTVPSGKNLQGEVDDLKSAFVNAEHEINGNLIVPIDGHELIQGSYNANGSVSSNNARIRTSGYMRLYKGQVIKFQAGTNIKQMFYGFRAAGSTGNFSDGSWFSDGEEWTLPADRDIILVFRKGTSDVITPSDYDATTTIVSYYGGKIDDLDSKFSVFDSREMKLYSNYLIDESTFSLSLLDIDNDGYLYRKETLPTTHNNVAWCFRKNDIANISTKVKFSSANNTGIRIFFGMANGDILWMNFAVTTAKATSIMFYNWSVTQIAGGNLTITPTLDTEHTLRVNFIGDYCSVYIDGDLVYNYNFASSSVNVRHISRVGYGFRGSGENAYFRPIKTRGIERFASISFDDQLTVLQTLTTNANTYSSLFDCPGFDYLLDMHNKYGCTFTLMLFRQWNASNPDFQIENTTTKFKSEFTANSSWLKFGYHGPDSTTYPDSMSTADLVSNVQTVYSAITSFAGSKCIDRVARMSMFNCTHEQAVALREAGLMVGFLTADDNRASNTGLSGTYLDAIKASDYCIDYENDIRYYRTSRRFDNYTAQEIIGNLCGEWNDPSNNQIFILFSHDFTASAMQTKLTDIIKWFADHGVKYEFPMNVFP